MRSHWYALLVPVVVACGGKSVHTINGKPATVEVWVSTVSQ